MTPDGVIQEAVALIASVPGYQHVAADLSRRRIFFTPALVDRGQASLLGTIRIGPETLAGAGDERLVSVAGTLVHEHWHTRQSPFLKTFSFWNGVLTRRHPMRRYEWPAYAHQMAFFSALAVSHPGLASHARCEQAAALASFQACYGNVPPHGP